MKPFLAACITATFAGCTVHIGDIPSDSDAGPNPQADAGASDLDAGPNPPADAGPSDPDAGPNPPVDAGSEPDLTVGMYYFGQWSQQWLNRSSWAAEARARTVWDLNRGYWIAEYNGKPVNPDGPFAVTVRNVEGGAREPLIGWYDDAETETLRQQVGQMIKYGIGYIAFAWYYPERVNYTNPQNQYPAGGTAIQAYVDLPQDLKNKMPYMLLWENSIWIPGQEESYPIDRHTWDVVIDDWIVNHFHRPEYVRIDNKPVVVIYSSEGPEDLSNPDSPGSGRTGLRRQYQAAGFNSPKEMLDYARERVLASPLNNGYDGIYFVLCLVADPYWIRTFLPSTGADAVTAYSIRGSVSNNPISQSFAESIGHHEKQWEYYLNNSSVPVWLPAWVGFNDTPWQALGVTTQDLTPTLPQLETLFQSANSRLRDNLQKTMGRSMIYAWNEYGEGGIAEPTVGRQYTFLETIRDTLKLTSPASGLDSIVGSRPSNAFTTTDDLQFTISLQNALSFKSYVEITVKNSLGNLVASDKAYVQAGSVSTMVDFGKLGAGHYFVEASAGEEVVRAEATVGD